MKVLDAVILAAGQGTRMLPASLYSPKESLPLIDAPLIHHVIWEACKAGVERIHIVVSNEKLDFAGQLSSRGKSLISSRVRTDLPPSALDPVPNDVEILVHIQEAQNGVGDAIDSALDTINGPFLVLLGDNLLISDQDSNIAHGTVEGSNASLELVQRFEDTGLPVVGIVSLPEEIIPQYGIVELSGERVVRIVEKPMLADAPSNLGICGRYVLPQKAREILNREEIKEMGELQSIGMLAELSKDLGLLGHQLENYVWYDSGEPIAWLKAQIDHALRRRDLMTGFRTWLENRLAEN